MAQDERYLQVLASKAMEQAGELCCLAAHGAVHQ